jgi:CRP-like cAMP-binding protein
MPASSPAQCRSGENRLLAMLPAAECRRLLDGATVVELRRDQVVYAPRDTIRYLYFPLGAVMSVTGADEDGHMAEVATVGREGMVGLPLLLDGDAGVFTTLCQIPDGVIRIAARPFRAELDGGGALRPLLNRYALAYIAQTGQVAACNALHPAEQRAARWILMSQDRVGSAEVPLTQEYLAVMLGVRRPTVTLAARVLQQSGLIRYHRGAITVVDRAGLEAAACECYGVIEDEYHRLLG